MNNAVAKHPSIDVGQIPRVAIILVNWNGWRDSVACIASCLSLDHSDFRILVCDNASADGSVEAICAWANGTLSPEEDRDSPVKIRAQRLPRGVSVLDRAGAESGEDGDGAELLVIRTGGNLGFAGGNNVGLRWAISQGYDYCWLLNNDTVVPEESLSQLLKCMSADEMIGLCGSVMVEYGRPHILQGYAAAMNLANFSGRHLGAGGQLALLGQVMKDDALRTGEMLYPIGASILVSAAFLEQIGLMDDGYFLYYEEADWVIRGQPHFRVAIAQKSLVYHKVGASAGSTPNGASARSVGFLYRSRLRIARLMAPSRLPRVVFAIIAEALRAALRGRSGRVIGAARALTGRVTVPGRSETGK